MKLRLSVTRYQNRPPDTALAVELSEHGGTIGRAPGNAWVLPDPERFISSHHAAIRFADGQFLLEDMSTNGVYVNHGPEPVGRGNSLPLNQGDVITIGDYEITADIYPADDGLGPDQAPANAYDTDQGAFGEAAHGWGQAPFAEPDVFSTSPSTSGYAPPPEGQYQAIPELPGELDRALDEFGASESDHVPGHAGFMAEPKAAPEAIPDDFWSELAPQAEPSPAAPRERPQTAQPPPVLPSQAQPFPLAPPPLRTPPPLPEQARPIPVAPIPAPPAPVPPVALPPTPVPAAPPAPQHAGPFAAAPPAAEESGDEGALPQLLAGAGVPKLSIPAEQRDVFFGLVGALMREMVAGMIEVLRARAEIKSQFRIQVTTIRPKENNPLKLAVHVDEALERLFEASDSAYMPPMEAVQEAMADIKAHQLAVIAGMQVALSSLLKHFEPHALERYFEAQGGKGMLESKKAWYWEQYTKLYKTIVADAEDNFQELFGDEFAKAYQTQIARMRQMAAPPRR